ncbi:MAG: OsmC family protein [Bryobacteraceae bacterium]|nr:OsmC family protein [Bryobacteraceae bacterium]
MIETTVRYLGAVQFEAESRGHKVICDQPESNRGFDAGMTPLEFLLVSVGTCAGFYAQEYLNTNHLPSEGLEVKVTAEKVKPPARLDQFKITIQLPADLEERHKEGVIKSVQKCVIHNTLHHPPTIDTIVTVAAPTTGAAA